MTVAARQPQGDDGAATPVRAGRAARRFNARHYDGAATVDGYLQRPYHRLRLELCRELLDAQLAAAFPQRLRGELRVLELGAASGELSRAFTAAGYAVTAADVETAPLRSLRGSEASCVCLDGERPLPFAAGAFHAVVMAELIEHLFDTRTLLMECARALLPGGVLVITTPNLATLQDRLRFLLGRAPRQVDPLHEYLYLHIRPFTFGSLVACLRWAGFERFSVRSNYVVFHLADGRRLESRLLARIFPRLGGSLIVAARKGAAAAPPADAGLSDSAKG